MKNKKRLLTLAIICAALTFSISGLFACGDEASPGLTFTLNDEGTYSVSLDPTINPTKPVEIVIPATYNGKPVARIGSFTGCPNLKRVSIPGSVTSIGYRAFAGCTSLTSITIPHSVKIIGDGAFLGCSKLVEVINKSNLNITKGSYDNGSVGYYALNVKTKGKSDIVNKNDYLFYTYDNINYLLGYVGNDTNLNLPKDYNGESYQIYNYAFDSCTSLTSITIPDSVTSIGDYAFYGFTSLTNVTIGNGVTSIGNYAFSYCRSLTSITIPDSVTNIGYDAFSHCSSLTNVTIGNGVTSIGSSVFCGCISLTSVTIPGSVTNIGYDAFSYCSSLTSITIPGSVTSIDDRAFKDCTSLTSITIGSDAFVSAFKGCASLTNVTILDSVTSIGERAFSGFTSLTNVTIGNGVTSIGNYAFSGCTSLTSVTIGNGVTSIGNYAFDGCYRLVEVINKSNLNITKGSNNNGYVGYYAINIKTEGESDIVNKNDYLFYTYDNINYLLGYVGSETNLNLPKDYNGESYQIYNYAFYGCASLTNVTILDSVKSIGDEAFSGCTSLTSVTIPDSVTSIDKRAFSDCTSLTNVTIGNGVTSIGYEAFKGCRNIKNINYAGSKEQWGLIRKGAYWLNVINYTIHCSDGDITVSK